MGDHHEPNEPNEPDEPEDYREPLWPPNPWVGGMYLGAFLALLILLLFLLAKNQWMG